MNMLKARLYDHEIKIREEANQNNENNKAEIGWGHQIDLMFYNLIGW